MEVYENLSLSDLDEEIWKEICGYDRNYFVSNLGRVKSFKNYHVKINKKILKPVKDNKGYFKISLSKNGKIKTKLIHILMYETFNNYSLKKNECIHHIDFTKNNILDNFQLMTIEEHTKLHHKGKTISEETKELMRGENNPMFGTKRSGEKSGHHTLKEQDVIEIRKLLDEGVLTQKEIGEKFRVDQTTISSIKTGKNWKI